MPIELPSENDQAPCATCGSSSVYLRSEELPRILGETRGEVVQRRVCGDRECPTNMGYRITSDLV